MAGELICYEYHCAQKPVYKGYCEDHKWRRHFDGSCHADDCYDDMTRKGYCRKHTFEKFKPEKPKIFELLENDKILAHGITFENKQTVVHWYGEYESTVVWPSVDDLIAINGHQGKRIIKYFD